MSNLYSRVDISGGSKSTSPPVKIWSVIGAIWIALFIYCMGSWVLGPDFQQNTTGRDQAPEWLVMYIRTIEVAMVLLTVWLLYRFVISPYLKTESFSFDGLFYLACGTLVIQEPWL